MTIIVVASTALVFSVLSLIYSIYAYVCIRSCYIDVKKDEATRIIGAYFKGIQSQRRSEKHEKVNEKDRSKYDKPQPPGSVYQLYR